jgi:16S rRNA (guanine527-N7)-methyltransferase
VWSRVGSWWSSPRDGRVNVSRETPSVPDAARRAFPTDRLPLAERYVELLATAGVERGLIGPREAPRLWDRHLLNCLALSSAVPTNASVADLGSGAGLPGLVLAIGRPDLDLTLVEPLLRRATFLEEAITELGLTGVRVLRDRAEGLHGGRRYDVVTARALAPLTRLLGWAMPLVAPRGVLLAMKGSSAAAEVAAAAATLRALGCTAPEIVEVSGPDGSSTATVVRVAHADPTRLG